MTNTGFRALLFGYLVAGALLGVLLVVVLVYGLTFGGVSGVSGIKPTILVQAPGNQSVPGPLLLVLLFLVIVILWPLLILGALALLLHR